MFAKIPERYMHFVRWFFALGWLVLIASLFYDSISAWLTTPDHLFAARTATGCYQFQGECRPLAPYPMGARIFWGMVVPMSILTLLVFGHEAWRRICPLSFLSQIPRALGIQSKRTVKENSWLYRNGLLVQFGLLFLGLNVRLLLVNSDRFLLGIFLSLTILSAVTVGFLFDGKTWCNYFCPMAPVQKIYSEPGGLLGSQAHTAPTKSITQSMCRIVDATGQEKSACVACKAACMDIDAELDYWEDIQKPDRKLLYYAYVGLVIGFYLYFWLYSGNWNFLSAGVWNETNQLTMLMSPGFYINGQAIAIPKLVAVPLTLTVCAGATYAIGRWAEKVVKRSNKRRKRPLSVEQLQSRIFAISTFVAFNLLFFLGVRPTIGYFPVMVQNLLSWIAILLSSLWLVKTWQRSAEGYIRERDGNLLRRQLHKLEVDFTQFLDGRNLDDLKPDELYVLAKVMPGFTHQHCIQVYEGVLREALEQGTVTPTNSLKTFQTLRQKLWINDPAHQQVLDKLQAEAPHLFATRRSTPTAEPTLWRGIGRRSQHEATVAIPRTPKPRGSSVDPTIVSRRGNAPISDADATIRRPKRDEGAGE